MTNSHLIIKTEKDGCSSWVLMYLRTAFFLTITRGKYMWLQKEEKVALVPGLCKHFADEFMGSGTHLG